MIGQKDNIKTLAKMIQGKRLPRFIILVGKKGSGKTLLFKTLAKQMHFQPVISGITMDDIRETIEISYCVNVPTMYLLKDADDMTINAKNAMLKVFEEPPKKSYFIMTVESLDSVLDTVISRATVLYMNPYSTKELKEAMPSQLQLKYLDNIGEIQTISDVTLLEAQKLVLSIIDTLLNGTMRELMLYTQQLRSKKTETEKIDIDLFMRIYKKLIIGQKYTDIFLEQLCLYSKLTRNKSANKHNACITMLINTKEMIKCRNLAEDGN